MNEIRAFAMKYLTKNPALNTVDIFSDINGYMGNVHITTSDNKFIWSECPDHEDMPKIHQIYHGGMQCYINPNGSAGPRIKKYEAMWVIR